jgi:hypothetical protein
MIQTLEKNIFYVTILFTVFVTLSLFLWPVVTQPLVWFFILVGITMAVIFGVHRDIQSYRLGHINQKRLINKMILDVAEILIAIIAAFWIAGKTGGALGTTIGKEVESIYPGMGNIIEILVDVSTGVLVGLCVLFLVRWVWKKLLRKLGY